MRGEAILIILLTAGCVGATEDGPIPPSTSEERSDGLEGPASSPTTGAPTLVVGQAWTYEGTEFYNEDASFTVVVAQAREDGYLFAAGAEDDIVYEALWSSRWYGERDRDLQRDGNAGFVRFPLADGASWEYYDGLRLVARAAEVATPTGREAGFIIEGANERVSIHVEYSPGLGAITLFETTRADGSVRDSLRMTRASADEPWVWYERGELAVAANPHEPAVFDLPEGFDNVLVSAGGIEGARAHVEGPNGAAFDVAFRGEETWRQAMLPATAGRWSGAVASRPFLEQDVPVEWPIGWAYMHVAPVKWVRGLEGRE